MIDIGARFGDNLKRLRRRADLSQDEVSYRASLHRTEVSQLERGLRLPRVDTVAKLAAALEADPGEFFEGIVWEPGNVRHGRFRATEDK
ncbi:MAG TPA: helix-turn-helix transcriptional regulator [Solirubrobacterales bacterium]|nr:helix-turn-helix transcriptional regulator [Solirubrobacterales bacterium]